MAVTKTPNGWRADLRPTGSAGKRYRKTFETKAEALRWSAWIVSKKQQEKEWEPRKRNTKRLSALIETWYQLHGQHLTDGTGRRTILLNLAHRLADPTAEAITPGTFTRYRQERLAAGVSPNTVNHEHAYLRALFNELERLGEWTDPNPLGKLRQLKVDETELSFLTLDQIRLLLAEAAKGKNPDTQKVIKLCLATGARWSEAETIRAENVSIEHTQVTFAGTKSGKVRHIPISKELAEELRTKKTGRLFRPCYDVFRKAIERAGIELPKGQLSHVLRHTFASHFMQRGGNILTLQKILGHSSLTMTMRYAHLSPAHLHDARVLNPLAQIGSFNQFS